MRRLTQTNLIIRADDQLISTSDDVVTMEDLIESPRALGYDANRAEWALGVIKSFGTPRQALGTLLLRLRDDGQIVLRLD